MAGISIEFAQYGDFDRFEIYRSETPMSFDNLPSPLAVTHTMYFYDSTVLDKKIYYYRIAAFKDTTMAVSEEFMIATTTGDIFFDDVDFLFLANSENYVTQDIKDYSKNHRTIINNACMVKPIFKDTSIQINGHTSAKRITTNILPLGVSDFTLEFWMIALTTSKSQYYERLVQIGNNNRDGGLWVAKGLDSDFNKILVDYYLSNYVRQVTSVSPVINNQWQHFCVMRKDKTTYLFIDGKLIGSNFSDIPITQTTLYIGANENYSEASNTILQTLRLTNGVARYAHTGFDLPDKTFDIGINDIYWDNVDLFIKSDGIKTKDYSKNNRYVESYYIDNYPYPKFSNSAIVYNNNRSNVQINALNKSDFTLEAWVLVAQRGVWSRIIQIGNNSTEGGLWMVVSNANGGFLSQIYYGSSYQDIGISNTEITLGSWSHICIMRKNGIFYSYQNGVLIGSNSIKPDYEVTQTNLYIGQNEVNNESFYGSIDSVRLTRRARYNTAGFDVPQKAFEIEG